MKRALLTLLACVLPAQAQPRTVIQTETRLVVVNAVVTDKKGERIRDLTRKDFHLWEDGKEQPLQIFSFETDAVASPAQADPQHLILFFDNQSLKPTDQVRARRAAASFIDAWSGENRLMAVMDYDGALRVSQNFTGNPGRLKDAVTGARYAGVTAVNPLGANTTTAPAAAGLADFSARGLFGALANLARNLNAIPGRKTIVVLSAGAPVSADSSRDAEAAIEASNRSNTGVYTIDLGDPMTRAGAGTADLSAADSPSSRFPVGGRGMAGGRGAQAARAPDDQIDTRALGVLTQATGGFVVRDASDLLRRLLEIGKEQSQVYVLGYTPPESKEGACHNLRVKVDRAGATARARSSYCSTKAQDVLAGSAAAKELETRAASVQSGNVSASMQLPFFYAGENVARVRLSMEIVPDALKFESRNGKLHAELNVLGMASTADGGVAARFSDVVKLDVEDRRAPVQYEKEFKIAPGQYNFTVVFSSGGAGFGKLEAPLVIEPIDRSAPGLSGVAFSKEARAASNLGLDAGLFEGATPLIANGLEFVPAASRQFRKDQSAAFYVEIYPRGSADAGIRMRILDRKSGQQKSDTGFLRLPPATAAVIPLGDRLPVTDLAPGAYTLELTALGANGKQFQRTADFDVR